MLIKIKVKTPKGKEKSSLKTFKAHILNMKMKQRVKKEKVTKYGFYWIININNQKEMMDLSLKCTKAELLIKRFFNTLFKIEHKGNLLITKFKRTRAWFKRWALKRLYKIYSKDSEMMKNLEQMPTEKFIEFFKFSDEEEMKEFLKQELITIDIL